MRILVFILSVFSLPVQACSVALVLAMDVSGSVSREEYALQMNGLADALGDPLVSEALVDAKALVTVVQWSGNSRQEVSIPWTAIDRPADVVALQAAVVESPRKFRNYATAIGEVLDLSIDLLKAAPRRCDRRVIDVSGDGVTNEGKRPVHVRPRLAMEDVTVNGLAIRGSEPGIVDYYREAVIFGPGAFVEIADGYEDYPRAIRRKLIGELAQKLSHGNTGASESFASLNTDEEKHHGDQRWR